MDIQLLTFHAFTRDGEMFVARQVESRTPTGGTGGSNARRTREQAYQAFRENAEALDAGELIEEVTDFVRKALPQAYGYPGKWAFVFSLPEETERGNTSFRKYVAASMSAGEKGVLHVDFHERAVAAAGNALQIFCQEHPDEACSAEEGYIRVRVTPPSPGRSYPKL